MANSEKDVYKEIKKIVRSRLKGRCIKVSDRHIAGIVDLYTCDPSFGPTWIEVKYETNPKRASTKIKLAMTANQRQFILDEQKCGGKAGWILCVKVTPRLWRYYAGNDPTVTEVSQASYICDRKAGEAMNIVKIMEAIHGPR